MRIWESLSLGAQALSLRAAATKPRAQIDRLQQSRLATLVRHARNFSPFYREKFAGLADATFTLADLPTSTKMELMDNFDGVVTVADVSRSEVEAFFHDETNLGKYFRDRYALSHTSGSQGQPLLVVQNRDDIRLLFALQGARGNRDPLSLWQVMKYFASPVRLAAVTLKRGFYPSACAFEYIPDCVRSYMKTLWISSSDADLAERLAEFRPTHLTAYASVLHELARQIERGKLSLKPELRQVVNISERLIPQARARYAEVFGAPILDNYAMGECLFLTSGCLTTGGMHVNADWAVLEVVDEHNRPVPNGTKGAKVLLTNLANNTQPFIRYEIGDLVTMATEPCGCGNNLPLVQSVEGRDSDIFWIHAGEGLRPLSPAIFHFALSQILDVREFQLVQEDTNQIRILIEPLHEGRFNREHAQRVMRQQLEKYDLDCLLDVEFQAVKRLATDDARKFKRVVSKCGDAVPKNVYELT